MYYLVPFSLNDFSPRNNTLSTMEREYLALSMSMHVLFPFEQLIQSIFTGLGIEKDQHIDMRCNLFEDTVGTFLNRKVRNASDYTKIKNCAVKYHHFQSCLNPENIKVLKMELKQQLEDIYMRVW